MSRVAYTGSHSLSELKVRTVSMNNRYQDLFKGLQDFGVKGVDISPVLLRRESYFLFLLIFRKLGPGLCLVSTVGKKRQQEHRLQRNSDANDNNVEGRKITETRPSI